MRPIYLDYAATTPLDPAVAEAMAPWWTERFGNPHSPHLWGYEADAAIAGARERVAALLGRPPGEVLFTSGATEAVNWALKGALTAAPPGRTRLVTLDTEHSCVLATARYLESLGAGLTVVPVHADGLVDLDALDAALGSDVALVSAMLVNNETGVIQPIADIAARAHAHGALMHTDAAQGLGKLPTDIKGLGVDLLSLTAHKLYGPKGVGALWRRRGVELAPLLHGGGQEGDGARSGTLSPALCVGLGAAAEIARERMDEDAAHARALWERLLSALPEEREAWRVNGSLQHRWPGTLSLTLPGLANPLDRVRGLAISAGSACASASGRPSHVLAAMGLSDAEAAATLRVSWGRFTTEAEIDAAAAALNAARGPTRRAA